MSFFDIPCILSVGVVKLGLVSKRKGVQEESSAQIGRLEASGVLHANIMCVEHFSQVYDILKEGDVVYVCSFAYFFSSISKLFSGIEGVFSRKCSIVSLDEPWLDVSAGIMGRLCELEHRMAVRRTKDGLEKARSQGRVLGRPKGSCSPETAAKLRLCVSLYENSDMKVLEICRTVGCNMKSFYKYMHDNGVSLNRRGKNGK